MNNNTGWGSFDSLRSLASAPDHLRGAKIAAQELTVSEARAARREHGSFAVLSLGMSRWLGKLARVLLIERHRARA